MLKYLPIFACGVALWFLITTIYAMSITNSYTRWQIGEIVVCLLILVGGVRHAFKPQP